MFTGLIQASGQLQSLGPRQLLVSCKERRLSEGLALGDSVAVDGVCLTVETVADAGFVVTVSPETLNRTTLGDRVDTDWSVNLEPALRVGDRLGGHFVTGHIDGLGTVQSVQQSAESWLITFTVPIALGRYMVSKGSVAINGISLTIADCTEDGTQFTAAVIPHSFGQTNLQRLTPQTSVNIETDVLGKYVAKFLRSPIPAAQVDWPMNASGESGRESGREPNREPSREPIRLPVITSDFLAEHGFV
ncbi:MAG: riboflavin synthase [Thermosynechococcaceae cyanobacterium MS004]|nr:riboflavin synthase [Thermosynechococcaceae cyanobacterium MS004]